MRSLFLLLVGFSLVAQELSLESLAAEVMRNKRNQDRDLTEYTYDYVYLYQYFNGKGKPGRKIKSEGETYQSSTNNVNVTLIWNDAPVEARTVEKKRLEAAKKLQADIDRRRARGGGGNGAGPEYGTDMFGLRMEIFKVLRNCPLTGLRTEMVDGRKTFVFDYGPAPGPVKGMAHLSQIRGSFWVDAEERIVRRWTGVVASGVSAGHRFWEEDYQKVPGRVWFAKRLWMNLNAELPGWKTDRVEWEARFSNHKRFGVEVEQKIEAPRP
ncbi:MAG: hypothetical protein NTW74_13465 [Acidobacteria bacterium]|nr:hypothetical protein [Acidobacteriota bacterium]